MRRFAGLGSVLVLIAALAAASGAVGTRAQADPIPPAGQGFVGSWRVSVTGIPGAPVFPVLSTYMADSTTIHHGPAVQPAPPGSPFRFIYGSSGHGVWEATGADTAVVTFVVLNSDEHGNALGTLTVSGTQRLEAGGDAFTGRYVLTTADPAGGVLSTFSTTAEATRIRVEPTGTPEAGTPQA